MKSFFLFSKNTADFSPDRKRLYFLCNVLLVFVATFSLCLCSLSLAYGESYSDKVFGGYFENVLIVPLNYLPILALFVVFYGIFSKGWIAYLADCIIVMGAAFVNFFLLKFRDDPLFFSDIFYFREAARISEEGYEYVLTGKMIFCIVVCVIFTVLLAFFQQYKPEIRIRCTAVIAVVLLSLLMKNVYFSRAIYDKYTDNYDELIRWSPTQKYVAKGFVYPFIYSMKEAVNVKPDGYNEKEIKKVLSEYQSRDIAVDKKVNIISVMLEAYCDVREMGIEGVDNSVYELYDRLKSENYSGKLVTNIFAAGTIDSERAFLTGYSDIVDFRRNVNSYVRYLSSQGYTADGSHPSEYWFYNRQNINKYLGFENFRFAENYFHEKYGDMMRSDSLVFEDFYENFVNHVENNSNPYFGFHVTYQGHAPYETDVKLWGTDTKPLYTAQGVSYESDCILNNYLGTIKDTGWRLWQFAEKIKSEKEPCVLLVFGDHKPWLGDGNSVYDELGINIDVSTKEGFLNYYSTEYVIIANDAAKAIIGDDFSGEGEMTSPCFLMNVLFEKLGYEANAFMQYTDTVMKKIPVINEVGIIDGDGNFYSTEDIPENLKSVYNQYKNAAYCESTNFVGE